eukprot:gene22060-30295_t
MIRDEQGFLSEWIAYYQIHGFDHFIIFDDGSVDRGLDELKPWIDRGIVSVRTNWTENSLNINPAFVRNDFKKAMTIKALLETECKLSAIKWNYDFYVSLDIDEYLIPKTSGETIVDTLALWANQTQRSFYCIEKFNYQSSPHILEPVNLLTIEAYHSRMPMGAKMNYYMSVSPKCAYRLSGSDYSTNTSRFVAECCHFHGCNGWDHRANSNFCATYIKSKEWGSINGRGKKWMDLFLINHYSRSLEKFALKSKTWRTASGEAKSGETAEQAAKSYDIPKFLARNVGWHHDSKALRYSCQVRTQLAEMTGVQVYLRPGDVWYRNPEFGKHVSDPDKRGRYGRPSPPGFKYNVKNPYHYHGGKQEVPG